jgi:hypothetical protein
MVSSRYFLAQYHQKDEHTHQKDELDKRNGFGLRFNATELCKVNKGRAGLTSFS